MKHFFKHIVTGILRIEAQMVLARHKPKIVAVVGSVGKTSTKDAVYTALSREFFVRRSEKSFNSEVGVPLTVLGLSNAWNNPFAWLSNILQGAWLAIGGGSYPEWLVLELGVDRPGDMQSMARWIHPNVVVLTRFASVPVHVEFFPTPEALIEEKCQIIKSIKKGGLLVLNTDDDRVLAQRDRWQGETVTYGFAEDADVHVVDFAITYEEKNNYPKGVVFQMKAKDQHNILVTLAGTLGKSVGSAVAAGTAVALHAGSSGDMIAEAFEKFVPPPGRLRILPGIKDTLIVDDSYNSSPVAAEHALETLSEIEWGGRKIAVLGDMLELGKFTSEAHRKIGRLAGTLVDIVATVGVRAREIAQGALDAGMKDGNVYQFDSAREAGEFLQNEIKEGDLILVKGSQGVRAERVVEELMANPERKEELLVRQASEWERR